MNRHALVIKPALINGPVRGRWTPKDTKDPRKPEPGGAVGRMNVHRDAIMEELRAGNRTQPMIPRGCRRLAEVDFPIAVVSRRCGYPSRRAVPGSRC